jgi:hypothetical protein
MSTPPDMPRAPERGSPTLTLTQPDFDAYLPERAGSNAYNRPRLELKQRMLAWARAVVARLSELGIAVDVTGSDEHPNVRNGRKVDCQRVFFWRDAESRAELERLIDQKRSLAARLGDPAPHKYHAYLGLKIDSAGVEVSIELHPEAWVDVKALRARLADPVRTLQLTSALEALPEQYSIGLAGEDAAARAPTNKTTADAIRALVDRSEAEKTALWIGWTVPRDVAIAHSEILDDQLEDAIVALGPVHKLVAWSKDDDLLVLDREVEAAKAERERAHEEAEQSRAEWESRREGERRARKERDTQQGKDELRRPLLRGRRGAPPSEREPEKKDEAAPQPERLAPIGKPLRAVPRRARVTEVDSSVTIEKGTRVQVLEGPFEGKVGVVAELDGKGGARVMLGLLALRLEVKFLIAVAEGRDRPALSSSHRKPLPARS